MVRSQKIISAKLIIVVGAYCFKREWRSMDVSQPRSWYIRLLILTLCAALYASMWGSYVYYNCEVVHNGEKIKLRDAVGNFMKSQAVQVNDLYEENLK